MQATDIILLGLGLLFVRWWWRRWSTTGGGPKNLPPGPPGWPIVGNLFQVILQRRHFIYVIRDLRKKYGPIFSMQMGQRTLIIVSSAELIHEALIQRGPLFASRPRDSPIRLIFSMGKCAINSAEYGPLWRTLRKNFVTEMITPLRIKQCSWIRKWAMEAHMKRIQQEAREQGFVQVMSNCRLTICSILICICFGAKIEEKRIKSIESILKDVMLITLPKLPDFLPVFTPLFRRQVKEAKELRRRQVELLAPLIRSRKAFVEGNLLELGNHYDMASPVGAAYVDSLFNLEVPGRGRLGEEELVTLVSEIISAGTVMLALEMRHFGVVGIDLSGNPAVGEWITYLLALKFAREQGLYVTLHCGEVSNSKEIHDMLDFLLQRIGHACFFKEEHWRRLKSSNIPVSLCKQMSFVVDLYNAKHPLVLCTDDSGVFSTSLSNEYKIAAFSFGLGQKELFELSKNAIEFIFADNVVKEDLRKKFNSAAKNLEL
ncbi:Cytochrome P450 77A1 [Glycine soja]|nr:Cytochrome P450 77A1 [Glycine soja]